MQMCRRESAAIYNFYITKNYFGSRNIQDILSQAMKVHTSVAGRGVIEAKMQAVILAMEL
jgi:hypothetical protein